MGGLGSGNHGGGPCVEDCRRIDIDELIRTGVLRLGEKRAALWEWTDAYTGERTDFLAIVTDGPCDERRAVIELMHRPRVRGAAKLESYKVRVVAVPQPFGGARKYFLCPLTGRRCSSLFLPRGGRTYGSRQAYGLAYRSQRQTPKERACAQVHKLRDRIDPGDVKPPRMRWATFDRKKTRIAAAEQRSYRFLLADLGRLKAMVGSRITLS